MTIHSQDAFPIALSVRIYTLLLAIYPYTFRREFGVQMVQVFQDKCRTNYKCRGARGLFLLWLATITDLLVTAFKERIPEEAKMKSLFLPRVGSVLALLGGLLTLVFLARWSSSSYLAPHAGSTAAPEATEVATEVATEAAASSPTPEPPTPSMEDLLNMVGSGEPDEEWNGIPIMREAINGMDYGDHYMFSVDATEEEILAFYGAEMERLGMWLHIMGMRRDEDGVFMPFSGGANTGVTISIVSAGNVNIVTINTFGQAARNDVSLNRRISHSL